MGLLMFRQMMRKFYLNHITMLNHTFTTANSFIILFRYSMTRQSLSHESFRDLF